MNNPTHPAKPRSRTSASSVREVHFLVLFALAVGALAFCIRHAYDRPVETTENLPAKAEPYKLPQFTPRAWVLTP